MASNVGKTAMQFFIKRAVQALDGTDPMAVAAIGEFFLKDAMRKPPSDELMEKWLFRLNNEYPQRRLAPLDESELRRLYYEAIGEALRITSERVKQLYEEARPTWETPPS